MRYPEVDLARFLAMLLMAGYHLAFDLVTYYGYAIDLEAPLWRAWQQGTLVLFLMLVGVSGVLMRKRMKAKPRCHGEVPGTSKPAANHRHCLESMSTLRGSLWLAPQGDTLFYFPFFRRGLVLLCWAMVITLVTYVIDAETFIRFGILHCIAASMFLLPFLLPFGMWNAPLGIAILLIGTYAPFPPPFVTLDYVPLLPNLGWILLGAAAGHLLYVRGLRSSSWQSPAWMHSLSVPGKYALAFYLVHQPVILGILWMLLKPAAF